MRIALDAMGGDYAPGPNILGALEAVELNPGLEVLLVGDRARLEEELQRTGPLPAAVRIVESEGWVGMDEKPTTALREKPNCSIARCWQLMAQGLADAVVSAGHTGAVVAAGLRTRLFLKGVKRPGIAVRLPTLKGSCILVDVGANPEARPEHLAQYALLQQSVIREHYVGNVEGRDVYHGDTHVIVCEGFVGNVILKVSEGMAEFLLKTVGRTLLKQLSTERELAQGTLDQLTDQFHYRESGGAPLLGIDGVCIICHGSSDHRSIRNALRMATEMSSHHINAQITELLGSPV